MTGVIIFLYINYLFICYTSEAWAACQWALLILQAFSHFTYVTAHSDSPSFLSVHLHHRSFSNPSLALPTSQLILQPFCCFTYITAHSDSPSFLSLHPRHSSFSNPSLALPMSQLILQPFHYFTYVIAHSDSPRFPSLYLRHSSFSNPSVASHTSQFIPQSFFRFFYVTRCSLNSPSEPPMISWCFKIFWYKIISQIYEGQSNENGSDAKTYIEHLLPEK